MATVNKQMLIWLSNVQLPRQNWAMWNSFGRILICPVSQCKVLSWMSILWRTRSFSILTNIHDWFKYTSCSIWMILGFILHNNIKMALSISPESSWIHSTTDSMMQQYSAKWCLVISSLNCQFYRNHFFITPKKHPISSWDDSCHREDKDSSSSTNTLTGLTKWDDSGCIPPQARITAEK